MKPLNGAVTLKGNLSIPTILVAEFQMAVPRPDLMLFSNFLSKVYNDLVLPREINIELTVRGINR